MNGKKKAAALTASEKGVVKALLAKKWRNQDIQALINIGRVATINSARITEIKRNEKIKPSPDEAVEFFQIVQASYDFKTGLNPYRHERLMRAREAMMVAVQLFNSPNVEFKTEIFSVLANISWTYLLHEFYSRQNVEILQPDGHMLSLSQMIVRDDCPISVGIKRNLEAIKAIRDDVEHKLLGRSDLKWLSLFQACCLNFDKTLVAMFGEKTTLRTELSVALQFSQMDIDQLALLQKYQIPQDIEALDARLTAGLTDAELNDLEYQFRVIYTLDGASRGRAHIEFVNPQSAVGEQIRNVLVKYKVADEFYPYRPSKIAPLVAQRSGKKFTSNNHTQTWHKFKVRPKGNAAQPDNTNKDYCIFHPAHHDYTYSEKWIEFIVAQISTDEGYEAIRAFKVA